MTNRPIIISNVIHTRISNESMRIPLSFTKDNETVRTQALLDFGAVGTFIDKKFLQKHLLHSTPSCGLTADLQYYRNKSGQMIVIVQLSCF